MHKHSSQYSITYDETPWERKCPYMKAQLNKLWYIHTMEYYEEVLCALIWSNFQNLALSEKSKVQSVYK